MRENVRAGENRVQSRIGAFRERDVNEQRADAVKEAFIFAWNGYYGTCKGQDELLPVTNGQ